VQQKVLEYSDNLNVGHDFDNLLNYVLHLYTAFHCRSVLKMHLVYRVPEVLSSRSRGFAFLQDCIA